MQGWQVADAQGQVAREERAAGESSRQIGQVWVVGFGEGTRGEGEGSAGGTTSAPEGGSESGGGSEVSG